MFKLLLHITFILALSLGWTQQAYIDAALSATTVTSNDQFTYKITTDCDCDITPPDLSAFDILQKMPGHMESTSNINGQVTKQCISTMTYVLRGKKKGKFKIGKAKVDCKNTDKQSESFTVEVLNADEVFENNEGKIAYYFKIESSKEIVKVGEPFLINFYMYTEARPQDINNINSGAAGGIFRENLFQERASNFAFPLTEKTVKGKKYYVIQLRKEVCIASAPGQLKIEPYFGRAVEQYHFFDADYMEGYSNSLAIKVVDVAPEIPENYYGMAGSFELSHEISQSEIKANRTIELRIKVSGTGNFNSFRNPELLFPESFLLGDPEIKESFQTNENGITGFAEYIYQITPTKPGKYNVLPYVMTYYDLSTSSFKSIATESFEFNITEGTGGDVISTNTSSEIITEDDIRNIHKVESFKMERIFGKLWWWVCLFIPILSLSGYMVYRKRQSNLSEEEKKVAFQKSKEKKALKNMAALQTAQSLDVSDIKNLKQTLDDIIMSKLDLSRSKLSAKNISHQLTELAADDLVTEFEMIWSKIEMAQFAPMSTSNFEDLANRTKAFVERLNQMK